MNSKNGGKRTHHAPRRTGTLEWIRGHRWVRLSMPDGTRPRYRLCAEVCRCHEMTEARARATADAIAERELASMAKELENEARRERGSRLTVEEFGDLWTSGKLYEKHGEVNKLKPKASADDDRLRLKKYVYKKLGAKPVADVTEQDIEEVLAAASKIGKSSVNGRTWRSKFQVYQVMHRLFDLAVMPGRLRQSNPVTRYLKPEKPKPPLYFFLYPAEFVALLRCHSVPVARRVLYALAVYTGLRKGSLYALTWRALDFENGTLTSLKSKTGVLQIFDADPGLMKLLATWYEYQGRPKSPAQIVDDIKWEKGREALALRHDLRSAGIARTALLEREPSAEPIRFHDLRATFVTWAKRQGRGDGWISDRSGHLTKEMQLRYDRGARMLADLRYVPFPDISEAIPELLERRDNIVSLAASKRR